MDIKRVNGLGEEIQKLVTTSEYGVPNPQALNEIRRLANDALHASSQDSYISENVSTIKSLAVVLYSQHRRTQYDALRQPEADRVLSLLFAYAYRLAQWSPQTDLGFLRDSSGPARLSAE